MGTEEEEEPGTKNHGKWNRLSPIILWFWSADTRKRVAGQCQAGQVFSAMFVLFLMLGAKTQRCYLLVSNYHTQ